MNILDPSPQDVANHTVEVETPTRAPPLPRRPVKSALVHVQNTGRQLDDASNEAPVHKPTDYSSPGPQLQGKKNVKITEKVQMAPATFYPTAQDDAATERVFDEVAGRGDGPDISSGSRGTVALPLKPSARVADSSQNVSQEQILSGLNLELPQLNGSGIGAPAASMQHAIIFSAFPTAHTAVPSGPVRRNSAGPADRQSKRARFSPPSGSREHSIHSALHALADVAHSMLSQRVLAPARKVGRTHRHLASSVEATAHKWCSEASGMTAKLTTADAAYQAALQKLSDSTRLAKEGAEERHTRVIQKMEASTNVMSIPDSLF
ncbi:uncharacterized protein LOC62_03G004076 [Vanrija pseudolonga]|uniref:Uncharacterized protein n=1 Tax=Vanrija pseudolonga TaxID=143232 RepID=A0AAF1BK28_9TREE|nr:hypothetical protein LOC62_03G004076 [Vanrija pseudolonga]